MGKFAPLRLCEDRAPRFRRSLGIPEPPRVPNDGCLSRRVVLTEEREIARLLLAPRAIANLFFTE